MTRYTDDLRQLLSKKRFVICVLLTALLAYGFAVFNMSVSIDNLESERYYGSGNAMLAGGRFTFVLLGELVNYVGLSPQNSYIIELLCVFFLLWAAVNFCILFRRICGSALTDNAATVFACVFVSYPLFLELWEYSGANLSVCFGFVCLSLALLLVWDMLHRKLPVKQALPGAALLMMLVCAGYEAVIPVYICAVFAVLALQVVYGTREEKTLKQILLQGICYAAILAAGLILRILVHRILLLVCEVEAASNGATQILWGVYQPIAEGFRQLMVCMYHDYVLKGFIYLPITELVASAVILLPIGLAAGKKHGWTILLPGAGMYLSLVLLSLLQGTVSPYRTCQVFSLFVAFAVLCVVLIAEKWKFRKLYVLVLVLCGYLCYSQAQLTNQMLTVNYLRTEEEAHVIRNIGDDLYRDFDTEKPVIFVGSYTLSSSITEAASVPEGSLRWQLYKNTFFEAKELHDWYFDPYSMTRKLPQTNVSSVLHWGQDAFWQEGMQHLFSFYGYDYVRADYTALIEEARAYAEENDMPAYPLDGYIQDVGDYIIIHTK